MSNGHRWSKFWWQDWQNDDALRACCFAAQGLWMRLLCIAHNAVPYGHLLINGKQPTDKQIASITGGTEREIKKLMAELEGAGVYSRKPDGTIYCRRMERDAIASDSGREWGKAGGNPHLNGKDHHPKNPAGGLTPPLNPHRYPTPLTAPVNQTLNRGPNPQDTDSEAEAKTDKKDISTTYLSGPVPAPEREEAASVADIEAQRRSDRGELLDAGYAGAVVLTLGKALRRPAYAPGWSPKRTTDEQAQAITPHKPKAAYLDAELLRRRRMEAGVRGASSP